jgi:hypothetical protein
VYSGVWRGQAVAVKIVTHGPSEARTVEREVQVRR